MIYYTYMYLREDGTPYYVGKGTWQRALREKHRFRIPPRERILLEPHTSEVDAFEAEKFLISYYGRIDLGTGCLRNLTIGGDGASGRLISDEYRRKLSVAKTGKLRPDMVGNTFASALKGRTRPPISEEWRKNLKAGQKTRWERDGHSPRRKYANAAEKMKAYRQRKEEN